MTRPLTIKVKAQYDGEDLGASEGLLVAVARLLDPLAEGEALELTSENPSVSGDLRIWCRRAGHRFASSIDENGKSRIVIERGAFLRTLADPPEWGVRMPRRGATVDMRDWLVGRHAAIEEEAARDGSLAPRGASLEEGAPAIEFSIRKRADVWANAISELYEQATSSQWVGARDIPWQELAPLDEVVERAVCQIMTFLAENEYAALYVPARFIGQLHPHFTEAALFLTTVMVDEARHIEVFTKRALANGGGLGVASATTQLSLASLLEPKDFSTASFLLSVLGEGTFLDLLAFLEDHAPERATREICRRARQDEARHVRFGIAHARYAIEADGGAARRFASAVEARAEFLKSVSGVGALIEESLIIYSGGGMNPSSLRTGTRRLAALYQTMHDNRVKRLAAAGFGVDQADHMSRLHTPNFM
ncbi:MAG TPA: ferritin-like domain-containing protein [Blastocatellia bacterium]|nr:ferritin-like domain-containing protein [Blastocatellia bacterium]